MSQHEKALEKKRQNRIRKDKAVDVVLQLNKKSYHELGAMKKKLETLIDDYSESVINGYEYATAFNITDSTLTGWQNRIDLIDTVISSKGNIR